ncbi:MAG: DUF4386 domain-containing protein [Acidimicrobiales bacterium]|nr:DUF4386 domain-containing protein [Acidimicrobiales bacterium]
MTTDVRTTEATAPQHRTRPATGGRRTPMTRSRKLALAAGVAYLLTFVFSIPTLAMKAPLDDADFILGAGSTTGVTWAALFDFICGVAGIASAVALYPVVRRQSRSSSLGFVVSRTLEGAILTVGAIAVMAMVTLREDFVGTGAEAATSLNVTGQALLALHDWSFLFGPGMMPAINALLLGSLLYRSRLVPRWLPTMGLVGAPLLLTASLGTLFGAWDQVSSPSVLVVPLALWELSLGFLLTFKGFRPSPLLDEDAIAPA